MSTGLAEYPRDRLHDYRGFRNVPSYCRIQVFTTLGQPPVVLATELADNPGTSITNAAETLADEIWHLLDRPLAGLVWIEYYPGRQGGSGGCYSPERFRRVTFDFQPDRGHRRPKWVPLTRAAVEHLIGEPLTD